MNQQQQVSICQPDDWHVHLRDGAALQTTVPHIARQFQRAIVMPNLLPPVRTVAMANSYYQRICEHIPEGMSFQPLMTLYLTDETEVRDIQQIDASDTVFAVKLYPSGATTHSDAGVSDIHKRYNIFEAMQKYQIPLLIHAEVTDPEIDIFDREAVFIDSYLVDIRKHFPQLKIVFEHITTTEAVDFVTDDGPCTAATITAHHLLFNRNDMLVGGIRPHYYCLPVLKRQKHQQSLIRAATGGSRKFFLGTDSAPHPKSKKENHCGCAGIYTAHAAIELYAQAFARANALDRLEQFASFNGADFYQLPRNNKTITLVHSPWKIVEEYPFAGEKLIPFLAGETINWKIKS